MGRRLSFALVFFAVIFSFSGGVCHALSEAPGGRAGENSAFYSPPTGFDPESIPDYSGEPWVSINDNCPFFTLRELSAESFLCFAEPDSGGRAAGGLACLSKDLMPGEERKGNSLPEPSGWQGEEYDFIDGGHLFNRCHLIGYQLSGENEEAGNFVTGTRYMNMQGILPFENMTAKYIKESGCHVMYRATAIYGGDSLICSGVLLEGWSVEDAGEGICFCVFCYNVQPGVEINYENGRNRESSAPPQVPLSLICMPEPEESCGGEGIAPVSAGEQSYILNNGTMKFHLPQCSSAEKISEKNREEYVGSREELIEMGYSPCGVCTP